MRALFLFCSLLIFQNTIFAQTPISFYPYRAGNIWQYRDCVTNEIEYTRYNDTTWVSNNSTLFIQGRVISSSPVRPVLEKIDTTNNVFNLLFQPDYPRYKLAADSGESWIAGELGNDQIRVTITDIYQDFVFGILTTIKVFTFESVPPPPGQPFWLGDEHLASEFGLVFALIEPSACVYLDGAIINGMHWGGPILSLPEAELQPKSVKLYQNYPNPFNPSTTIQYEVPVAAKVELTVYDLLGKEVTRLVDARQPSGTYRLEFDGSEFSSGVYLYRLKIDNKAVISRKMVLIK